MLIRAYLFVHPLRKLSSDPKFQGFKAEQLFELFEGTQIDAFQTTIGRKIG